MKLINFLILPCLFVMLPTLANTKTEKAPELKHQMKKIPSKTEQDELDWGDWQHKFKPQKRYEVGIKKKLQNAINALDKSNLTNDSDGVQVSPTNRPNKPKKVLDIKKMKAELKALEKKVEQEIEDDID